MVIPRPAESYNVKFLVGAENREFLADKFGLAYHSAVFRRMFDEYPSKNEFVVPDVDADAFEVMLSGIAGREVTLDQENVAAVYDVVLKYDLRLLRQMCETFAISSINSSNPLVMLNSFHNYNVAEINEECLSYILEEPLEYFDKPEFLEAPADVIRMIFKTRTINCSVWDLKVALSVWMTNNGLVYNKSMWFEDVENHLQISRNELESKKLRPNVFFKFDYSFTDKCVLETSENLGSLDSPVYLHGFGLAMGKVPEESIKIEISTDRNNYVFTKTVVKEGIGKRVSIQDVFFESIQIFGVILVMKITFVEKETQRVCVQYNKQDSFVAHFIFSSFIWR
jgi:BTB/POZ domain